MNNIHVPIFLIFIISSCIGNKNDVLSVKEFNEKMSENEPESVIIDLRTTEEMNNGRIKGAIQLDFHDPDFNQNLNALAKDKPYFIYCMAGGRSGRTFDLMQEQGFQEIYDLKGGMNAWLAAKMEVDIPD